MLFIRLWLLVILLFSKATLFNYLLPLALLSMIVTCWQTWKIMQRSLSKFIKISLLTILGSYLITELLWLFFDNNILWLISQLAYISFIILNFFIALQLEERIGIQRKILVLVKVIISLLLFIPASYLMLGTLKPAMIIQSMQGINSYEPQTTAAVEFDTEKYKVYSDIEYSNEFPNSFMDIITIKDNPGAPTYFYIHGGGFTSGDKMIGDPNSHATENYMPYFFTDMLEKGYNIVSINYALAPEYIYPVAIHQASQAITFLQANGEKYGIDMSKVIIAGGSSGGYIAAALVTAQLNPNYAKSIDLKPVLGKENIQAMILESPALNPGQVGHTESPNLLADYIFQTILGAYLGTTSVSPNSELVNNANLLTKINNDFPPTFLSDGNYGTWPNQSTAYAENLRKFGIYAEVYIPSKSDGKKGHGFMARDLKDNSSKKFLEKRAQFIEHITNNQQ